MAWTAPRTYTTGEIITAAILNAHVRDNLLETAPALAGAAGDTFYADAANSITNLAKGTAKQVLSMNDGETAPEWVTLTAAQANAVNRIATGSTSDPNTTQEPYIVTNHANSPGGGVYWHIKTFFYTNLTGNRGQVAIQYNGTGMDMYMRRYYVDTWTSWNKVISVEDAVTDIGETIRTASTKKLRAEVNSSEPSSPQDGDLWYDSTNDIFKGRADGSWVSFGGIKSAQHGTASIATSGGTYTDVTISSVDTSKAIVLVSYKADQTAATSNTVCIGGELTSSTNLRLHRYSDSASYSVSIAYTVIEYSVVKSKQSGKLTMASTPDTVTITSVDTSKSILVFSYTSPNSSVNMAYSCIRGTITNSTTLTFDVVSGINYEVYWQVVEFY